MTKKDYLTLAQCLRRRIATARADCDTAPDETTARQHLATWVDTARELADNLNVDKRPFLVACGVL